MKESESQVAPTLRITSSDVQRENRIPPRQVLTRKWPILHAGSVPEYAYFDSLGQTQQDWRAQWTFRIWGLVEAPWQCNYHEFIALPRVEVLADMHFPRSVVAQRCSHNHGRLAHQAGDLQRLADHALELVRVERLEQVVEGALPHGLDGGVRRLG